MRKLTTASVLLLLATNVAVLAGVLYNRSGPPLVEIELTERELPIYKSFRSAEENSGTALSLTWNVFDGNEQGYGLHSVHNTPAWLNHGKLADLGFEISAISDDPDRYRNRTSLMAADAVLVLEYDGDAYRKALVQARNRLLALRDEAAGNPEDANLRYRLANLEKQVDGLEHSQSRLYVVDVAADKHTLVEKYADSGEYLFAKGIIGLRWSDDDVEGYIRQLLIPRIHVPLPYSRQLAEFARWDGNHSDYEKTEVPRYRVRLNVGNRIEPWIESTGLTKHGHK